jgi:hypothetical protein
VLAYSPDGAILAGNSLLWGDRSVIRFWDAVRGEELPTRFRGHQGSVTLLRFAPDGRTLLSGSTDTTVLAWDTRRLRGPRVPADLDAREAEAFWADLPGGDAKKAYAAVRALSAAPAALALFREHLKPATVADPERVARLLTDLGSERFAVREQAGEELQKLGDTVEPLLREALAKGPDAEVRHRIERLLEAVEGHGSPDALRGMRSLEVLERLGTPEARELIERLAGGAPGALLTRQAEAARQRLKK